MSLIRHSIRNPPTMFSDTSKSYDRSNACHRIHRNIDIY